ncbi:type II toxin-antitoxin system RelE/ParE family toxin [Azospirillum sp. B510]|uniref:type II toxin-antitoxin system RelE/ParE family toxin n=1 Tax=Azospirillum sp. (strain B510) TaxID=137722 RepID=UPI0011D09812|nr:type II toxin-antitoxin system RelE/ParE family toxin [Azospirillum sp. B510]
MNAFRLSGPAEAELDDILDWSERNFHEVGRIRYAALLVQAMRDIVDDPRRSGIEWVQTAGQRVGLYHSWHSRTHIADPADRIQAPRHLSRLSARRRWDHRHPGLRP